MAGRNLGMVFWSAAVLAIALSLDGIGVGFAYGLRKIRIPVGSLLTIASCSMLAMTLSMFAGHGINSFSFGFDTSAMGALILIVVGIWQLVQGRRRRPELEEEAVPALSYGVALPEENLLFKIYIKR